MKKHLTLEEVEGQINLKSTIAEKLDYWCKIKTKYLDEPLTKTHGKYFSYEANSSKKREVFGKDFLPVSPLGIPVEIYEKHFEKGLSDPDFTFWFLKYNAHESFEQLLIRKRISNKIQSPIAAKFIEAELIEIKKFEEEAEKVLTDFNLDIYKYNHPSHTNFKEIEYLRIKADFYKENALPEVQSSGNTTVALYATHVLLKNHLKDVEQKITKSFDSLEEGEDFNLLMDKPAPLEDNPLEIKLIFNNGETRESFYKEIKGFFPGKEMELGKVLNGEVAGQKLMFPGNATSFVEIFRRLSYNGLIFNDLMEIRDWLCLNFNYRYKKGTVLEERDLKETSVYDVLKGKNEPSRNNRLLQNLEWLPYLTKNKLKEERINLK